jgi:uncharacterized membrane protein YccC
MKPVLPASLIFSIRTFAAAMLALYLSYQLDLSRPTWAFITTYVVSTPLRGAVRSKGLYRICGTIGGAAFTVIAVPNLVDAPELLALTIAVWIAGCLYLSIIDGTPRSYALMLAGFTAALIGFPSVNAPQTIFDTAISRTEEIGIAILCIELMGYLPFNQRAGEALEARIEKSLLDMRALAISLMTFSPQTLSISDRARLMIDAANMNTLRIQAHYDTPHFEYIEGWVVHLQRHLRDFFVDLVTFDAQVQDAQARHPHVIVLMRPITDAILAWIENREASVPRKLRDLLKKTIHDPAQQELIKNGIFDTLANMVARRHECLVLHQKILARTKAGDDHLPIAPYIDYRQAVFYGLAVATELMIGCTFWILTGWPEGGIMVMLGAVVCCFFASLETPPNIVFIFLIGTCVGTLIGWGYNFLIFPHIEGFPLLVVALAFSCIPIGIVIANPKLGALMLPVVLGINVADFQNRFEANIAGFLNNFIAQSALMFAVNSLV